MSATINAGTAKADTQETLETRIETRAAAIRKFLVTWLARELKQPAEAINIQCDFMSFGLDSIVIFGAPGDLAAWLGRDLEASLFWEHPTVDQLARALASQIERGA